MRDLLSKLDAIVSETSLKDPEDLKAKRKALGDLESDPVARKDPEISAAITQRKQDLEREAKSKGFAESFEIGDEFGISFSEDFEIGSEIVGFVEDGIVIQLDDAAVDMLANEGLHFLEGELVENIDEARGSCWVGYEQKGMKKKGDKMVPNCVKEDELAESGLQYYTGVKKHGEEYMRRAAEAGRKGASQEELGRLKDRYSKAEKNKAQKEDHGPEHPDAPVNYGEYDREGDMAKDDLRTMDDAVEELYSILQADENLPEWVQSKITKAVDYIDTARDYMKAQKYEEDSVEEYGDTPRGQKMLTRVQKRAVDRVIRADDKNRLEPDVNKRDLKAVRKNAATADRAHDRMAEGGREMTGSSRDRFISAMTPRIDNDALMQKVGKVVNSPEFDENTILKIVDAGSTITHPVGRYIQKEFEELQYDLGRQYEDYPERVAEKLLAMLIDRTKQGMAEGDVDEAKYHGREVPLGKKMAGDVKKSKVYVRKPNGNIVKVNFGDKKMRIKKSNPARRKSFRARHNCANPGPRHKARYWSCRSW